MFHVKHMKGGDIMRLSIEQMVDEAILNEKSIAERRVRALISECHYEQNRSYDPYSNAIVVADVYHIPCELLEKCYGKSRAEILDMLI